MKTRFAKQLDLTSIYMMGADVWCSDQTEQEYIEECKNSNKYKMGQWYCLEQEGAIVSSLIQYKNCFGLRRSFAGFGSVATSPQERKKGYARALIMSRIETLVADNYSGVYLFNETRSKLYESCGFESIANVEGLMFLSINGGVHESSPSYF